MLFFFLFSRIQIKKSRKLFRITNVEHGQSLKSDQYIHKLKQHFEKSTRTPAPKWANLNKAAKRDIGELIGEQILVYIF